MSPDEKGKQDMRIEQALEEVKKTYEVEMLYYNWMEDLQEESMYKCKENITVLGSHLSYPGWGTIIRWEGRRYFQPLKNIKERSIN